MDGDQDDRPRGSDFPRLCDIWINRARSLPLSFLVSVLLGSLDPRIQALVNQHTPQLQNLDLRVGTSDDLRQIKLQGPFPSLKRWTLRAPDYFLSTEKCVDFLRRAPALLECHFHNVEYDQRNHYSYGAPLFHTSLRELYLGNTHDRVIRNLSATSSGAHILQYLTLPALKSLEITDWDIEDENFNSFLTHSSPPLESLRMVMSNEHGPFATGTECFRLVPSLTDLELSCSFLAESDDDDPDNENPFLPFLTMLGTAQGFLPNLRNLTIYSRRTYYSEHTRFEDLISVLAARHASRHTLASFRLIFPLYSPIYYSPPEEDIILTLRRLATEGFHIHVGSESLSLIEPGTPQPTK
ncbi:hypothetical protein B0H19DRAFT_1374414 [Mycena capillaripes]|nr:hypothetical protein B0H19DRAFT_1374414 [Mycena capillaripes]